MSRSVGTPFRGKDGLHGWVEPHTGGEPTNRPAGDTASWVSVKLADGRRAFVPENAFISQADGSLYLPLNPTDLTLDPDDRAGGMARRPGQMAAGDRLTQTGTAAGRDVAAVTAAARGSAAEVGDVTKVPVIEERLEVGKREVEAGVVRARKVVHERQEAVDVPLARERVEVERVPINRVVDQAPAVRTEGDVTIIPVVEEVLVVEKRLMLREEVRLTKRREETHEQQTVTLRREEVEITRDEAGKIPH
jgi:uncharacterized protein (TIGR02271 family)